MRIRLTGQSDACKTVGSYLLKEDFVISPTRYGVSFDFKEEKESVITINGQGSSLRSKLIEELENQGEKILVLKNTNNSDVDYKLQFDPANKEKVERAVFRALLREFKPNGMTFSQKLKFLFFVSVILLSAPAFAQVKIQKGLYPTYYQPFNSPIVRFWDGTQVVNAGDFTNNAVRVNCVIGCGSGGAVTANQGTANTQPNRWPVFLSDGTNEWGTTTNPFNVRFNTAQPITLTSTTLTSTVHPAGFTSISSGQQAVTSSAVVLPTVTSRHVCIRVLSAGTQTVYFGPAGVTTGTGMELLPGDGWCGSLDNLNRLFVIATAGGSTVAYEARN